MDETALADRIRGLRLSRGVTRKELAQTSGVSESALNRLENGTGSSVSTLLAVCRALGVEIMPESPAARRRRASRLPDVHRSSPRPEDQRAFELHREVVRVMRTDPESVIARAVANLAPLRERVVGGHGQAWVDEWEQALRRGPIAVEALCLRDDEHGDSLRQVGPFLGVLTQSARAAALGRSA